MSALINVVLPVFLVIGAAALAQGRLKFDARTISRVTFYLFVPSLVFDSLANSTISSAEIGLIAAVITATTAVLWALGALIARLLRLEGPTRAAFLTAILVMNAGNYGLPVVLFAFGPDGMAPATVCLTGSAILSASVGVFLSASGRASGRQALRRVAGVPLVYAALLGLVLNLAGWAVPEPLGKAIHLLGQASVPCMLVVLGVRLVETARNRGADIHLPALGAVTVLRLVVAPALTWLFAGAVGLQGLARDVTVLENAMPTAVITTILAAEFDSDPSFAALCVLVTTLASMLTVTLLLNLLM